LRHLLLIFCLLPRALLAADDAPRARDLGIPFDGTPGPLNAITDVPGVTVGQTTVIDDLAGNKAIRTGVTAVLPRGMDTLQRPAFAGTFALNGNGEMTGTTWIEESGFLEGPVMMTNTHSVGAVFDATIKWRVAQDVADASGYWWSLPVVAETWDGYLNDINGFHVNAAHVAAAIESSRSGAVAEGNVGAGTGTTCYGFKCGIGTSSRVASTDDGTYTVGALVQANHGWRRTLRIGGIPVGRQMMSDDVRAELATPAVQHSSIIIVVATDAPLLATQLRRLARRAGLGLARTGGMANNGSGDIFLAFSTANENVNQSGSGMTARTLANDNMSPLFDATVEAVEEAIINAMIAARDMTGTEGHVAKAIDHEVLRTILRKHDLLQDRQ
jgi:D-aminopeptidase